MLNCLFISFAYFPTKLILFFLLISMSPQDLINKNIDNQLWKT